MKVTKPAATERIAELESACDTYIAEIARLEAKVGELQGEIAWMDAELMSHRGVRHQAHGLYKALDDALSFRIRARGLRKRRTLKKRDMPTLTADQLTATDKASLMRRARSYDAQAFFRRTAPKAGMRLRYRVLDATYRGLRNVTVYGLKRGYRLMRRAR